MKIDESILVPVRLEDLPEDERRHFEEEIARTVADLMTIPAFADYVRRRAEAGLPINASEEEFSQMLVDAKVVTKH